MTAELWKRKSVLKALKNYNQIKSNSSSYNEVLLIWLYFLYRIIDLMQSYLRPRQFACRKTLVEIKETSTIKKAFHKKFLKMICWTEKLIVRPTGRCLLNNFNMRLSDQNKILFNFIFEAFAFWTAFFCSYTYLI